MVSVSPTSPPAPRDGRRPAPSLSRRMRRGTAAAYARLLLRQPMWDGRATPRCGGRFGPEDGDGITLLVLGDSSALSVGVERTEETVGAVLADRVATSLSCPVELDVLGRAGATTNSMAPQVRLALRRPSPGVALILVGGNDVFLPGRVTRSAAVLGEYVRQLSRAGWHVVVGTCSDVSAAPSLRPWCRPLVGRRAHALAREQARAALSAGAAVVSLTVPDFRAYPDELFCADRFHPSARGYALYLERGAVAVEAMARAHRTGSSVPRCDGADTAEIDRAAAWVISEPGASVFPVGTPVHSATLRRFVPPAPVRPPARAAEVAR